MRAGLLPVVLLIVFLLEVDVIHLLADLTFLDVSSTVPDMGAHLALGVLFLAVVAQFKGFVLHRFRNYGSNRCYSYSTPPEKR